MNYERDRQELINQLLSNTKVKVEKSKQNVMVNTVQQTQQFYKQAQIKHVKEAFKHKKQNKIAEMLFDQCSTQPNQSKNNQISVLDQFIKNKTKIQKNQSNQLQTNAIRIKKQITISKKHQSMTKWSKFNHQIYLQHPTNKYSYSNKLKTPFHILQTNNENKQQKDRVNENNTSIINKFKLEEVDPFEQNQQNTINCENQKKFQCQPNINQKNIEEEEEKEESEFHSHTLNLLTTIKKSTQPELSKLLSQNELSLQQINKSHSVESSQKDIKPEKGKINHQSLNQQKHTNICHQKQVNIIKQQQNCNASKVIKKTGKLQQLTQNKQKKDQQCKIVKVDIELLMQNRMKNKKIEQSKELNNNNTKIQDDRNCELSLSSIPSYHSTSSLNSQLTNNPSFERNRQIFNDDKNCNESSIDCILPDYESSDTSNKQLEAVMEENQNLQESLNIPNYYSKSTISRKQSELSQYINKSQKQRKRQNNQNEIGITVKIKSKQDNQKKIEQIIINDLKKDISSLKDKIINQSHIDDKLPDNNSEILQSFNELSSKQQQKQCNPIIDTFDILNDNFDRRQIYKQFYQDLSKLKTKMEDYQSIDEQSGSSGISIQHNNNVWKSIAETKEIK